MRSKDVKKRSQIRERYGAKQIGGKPHAGSGNTWSRKADFSNTLYLIEDKFTDCDYYVVAESVLKKVEKEAQRIGKTPALRVGFERFGKNFIIIKKKYWHDAQNTIHIKHHKTNVRPSKSMKLYVEDLTKLYQDCLDQLFFLSVVINNEVYCVGDWDSAAEKILEQQETI